MNRSNRKDDSGPCYLFGSEVFLLGGMKMVGRRIVIFSVCGVLITSGFAQPQPPAVEWERTYGGQYEDAITSVLQLPDRGYVFGGTTLSYGAGLSDFWLMKTDADGDCVWSRTYGGESMDDCWAMKRTIDGGYILAGSTLSYGSGGFDCWLVKTDANGDSLWSRTFGGSNRDYSNNIFQALDGGYVLLGGTKSFGAGFEDIWLVKTDVNGDSQWSRTYGGSDDDWSSGIVQTTDGGYSIAGTTYSYGVGWNDFWLIKVDANGDSLWSRTYGGTDPDNCTGLIQTIDGGYILVGIGGLWPTRCGFRVVKTNSNGTQVWDNIYSFYRGEKCYSVQQTTDGGYILAGFCNSTEDNTMNGWLVKIDDVGDSLWNQVLGGSENDIFSSVIQTADGGYIAAGSGWSFGAGLEDAWLVKLGPEIFAEDPPIPRSAYLLTACPNPFNSTTQIEFTLPVTQRVALRLYDVLGREVAVMLNEMKTAGEPRVRFDGSGLSSGVYFCRMEAGRETRMQKIVLMK